MSNKGIMKTAVIYFEGKEVCFVNHDSMSQLSDSEGIVLCTRFCLKNEEVGFFNGKYCYEIIENVK